MFEGFDEKWCIYLSNAMKSNMTISEELVEYATPNTSAT